MISYLYVPVTGESLMFLKTGQRSPALMGLRSGSGLNGLSLLSPIVKFVMITLTSTPLLLYTDHVMREWALHVSFAVLPQRMWPGESVDSSTDLMLMGTTPD